MSFLNLNTYIGSKISLKNSGSLSDSPFYTILGQISKNRFSGKLVLSKGDRIKHVYFDKGNPTSIKSNLVAESLYSIISRKNLLSRERMGSIVEDIEKLNFLENLDFEQKLFMYLKEKNYLTMDELNQALKQQFHERLLNLFGWFSGEYTFEKDSHLIYNLSPQIITLKEVHSQVEQLIYPKRSESENRGMGEIEGNFKDTFFPDLLGSLIAGGATGKLVMQKKDRTKILRMHSGVPVSVSSDHPSEKIGKLLVRTGLLKIDEWMKLEDETKFIKNDVCEIALRDGLIKENEAKLTKAISYVERLLELFGWRSGLYRFERRKSIKCPACDTQIQIKFDLDPYNYACPKCRGKLTDKPVFTPSEKPEPEKKAAKALALRFEPSKTGGTEIKKKEKTIKGIIPETHYCSDCGKAMDPVIKKCTCCDETLLDAYQFKMKQKEENPEGLEPSLKSENGLKAINSKSQEKTQFDILASNVIALSINRPLRIISFTGPTAKSGKSFVALNAALSLCENFSKKVLLIDASFKSPSLCFPLELKPEFDLQDSIRGEIEFSQALYETSYDNLFLLPLKTPLKKPDKFFNEDAMDKMLIFLKDEFDFIFIDGGFYQGSRFERYFYEHSDGVILVLKKGFETRSKVQSYLSRFDKSKILGTVLNRIDF